MPLLAIALALLVACSSQQPANSHAPPAPSPTQVVSPQAASTAARDDAGTAIESSADAATEARADVRPAINERFLDPKLDVERWQKNFEGESREVYAARKEVLAALQIAPGQSVADIGAGTGFYLLEFAKAVGPSGHVYGVEISPRFLEKLRARVAKQKVANASIITGTERSVKLADNSVDAVFICDTYHHFEYPQSTLASIRSALRPGGTLTIVDFERIEGKTKPWILEHVRAGQAVFKKEIEAAGFELIEEPTIAGFKENYMLRFRVLPRT
tara:strand:- start:17985 stop:18803 length:819 start_codon:yes stop_codon:yes gene_type:complete